MFVGLAALVWLRSTYARNHGIAMTVSGYAIARRLLDLNGLHAVSVEQTPGYLTDHYDFRSGAIQLTRDVYHGRSAVSVGVASRLAGQAVQQSEGRIAALARNAAAVSAGYGYGPALLLAAAGVVFGLPPLALAGVVVYNTAFLLQLAVLPFEYAACRLVRSQLADVDWFGAEQAIGVARVMNASVGGELAATLQPIVTLLYYLSYVLGLDRTAK
jgi:Zn-dependent membrane protease YugP